MARKPDLARRAEIARAAYALMRERVNKGLEVLKGHSLCDRKRTAAIGYCFGATCV